MMESPIQNDLKANLLDVAPVSILFHDLDHNVAWVNRTYTEATGLSLQEISGKKCHEVWGLSEPCPNCPGTEAIETGEPCEAEVTLQNQELSPGVQCIWQVRAAPVRHGDGSILGAVEIAYDITELKQADMALRESEEKYRLLFENMSEGFVLHEIITDEQGRPIDFRFLEMNPACERLTGLARAEWIGRRVRELTTETPWIERYGRVGLSGKPEHFEEYSTNLEQWLEVFAYQPRPGQCAAIFIDVGERKRSEEKLRQSNDMLNALVQSSPSAIIALEREGNITLWNQAATTMYGWEESEAIGRLPPYIPESKMDEFHALRKKVLGGEGFKNHEIVRKKKEGSEIHISLSTAPLRDSAGNCIIQGHMSGK